MQNWKIKKMSYQELIGQSKAVDSMLYYYQRGKDFPRVCPLCKVTKMYHRGAKSPCNWCLWKIIEEEDCNDFAYREFKAGSAGLLTGLKKWHKKRIPMLRRWKKILQGEMDSRTEGGGG